MIKERDNAFGIWNLDRDGRQESVRVSGPLSSNNGEIVLQWALDGRGVLLRSLWDVKPLLEQGRLVQVLDDYSQSANVWAVYPTRLAYSGKLRACVEFLQEHFFSHLSLRSEASAGRSRSADHRQPPGVSCSQGLAARCSRSKALICSRAARCCRWHPAASSSAVLAQAINLELDHLAVRQTISCSLKIHADPRLSRLTDLPAVSVPARLPANQQHPVALAVVVEDPGKTAADQRANAHLLQAPHRMLAAGAAAEIRPDHQETRALPGRLVQHEVGVWVRRTPETADRKTARDPVRCGRCP